MLKFKNTVFYLSIIGGFAALMYWIVLFGTKLEIGKGRNH